MMLESREDTEKKLSEMKRTERRSEMNRRSRQVVGIVCAKIFDAKAQMKYKKNDIWRIVLLCDLIYYDHIEQNRAEIQNRTGVRLIDIVLSYENKDYLEVIDIPQEYTVAFKKVLNVDNAVENGEKLVLSNTLTSGLFYHYTDALRHMGDMKNEFEEVVKVRVLERDSFVFDEHDPEGTVRSGAWRSMVRTRHEQVIATHPKHGDIEVDAGLKQLLEALWELGYETLYSCEDEMSGNPYILFPDLENAERFVREGSWGGHVDQVVYFGGRRAVRGFSIPPNIEVYKPNNK